MTVALSSTIAKEQQNYTITNETIHEARPLAFKLQTLDGFDDHGYGRSFQ